MAAPVLLQHLLPKRALSRLTGRLARSRNPLLRALLVRSFVALYRPDLSDAVENRADAYACFNDLFTRALVPGARAQHSEADALTSPVDGTLSQFGYVSDGTLLQAKGRHYPLAALLGVTPGETEAYAGGFYATVYLAPYNYHRIHMPMAGQLTAMRHLPGKLFSVSLATARRIDGLFVRNERVVCEFSTARGPLAMVLVGALNVGSIETVWHGEVAPSPEAADVTYPDGRRLERGDEMGRFNLGSTVILVTPPGVFAPLQDLREGLPLRVGERLARNAKG